MTYAQARLWVGISGVGLMVSLSAVALYFDLPGLLLGGIPKNWLAEGLALAAVVGVYALLHWPLDHVGGYVLPCNYSRQCQMYSMYISQYLRGAVLQGLILVVSANLILHVGRLGGRIAVLFLLVVLMLLLTEWQDKVAQLVGGFRSVEGDIPTKDHLSVGSIKGERLSFLDGFDPGFSGGVVGLPGRERLVLPFAWSRILPKGVIQVAALRRAAARQSGSRSRGLLLAILWNVAGFYGSSLLPQAGVSSVAEVTRTFLGFTIWSFLGLLLLPTLSRLGVFEVDQYAKKLGVKGGDFALAVRELDQLQDDEPQRPAGVETIFHPIPSVERRLAHFAADNGMPGAWNAARYALYLSWPCVGLLSRAVHCNSGRPELWVMLPTD